MKISLDIRAMPVPEPSAPNPERVCKQPSLKDKICNACAITRAINHPKRQMAIRFLQEVHQHLSNLPQLDEEASGMLELTKGIVEEYGIPSDLMKKEENNV